jgi:hypothetical protein
VVVPERLVDRAQHERPREREVEHGLERAVEAIHENVTISSTSQRPLI